MFRQFLPAIFISQRYLTTTAHTISMPNPPIAPRKPVSVEKFGDQRVDEYFWLRERTSPGVIDYLNAENAYTQAVLGPLKGLQETLYQDMLSRIKETDENVPYRKGEYWYYSRTEAGKQYSILCRKKGSLEASEEIVLDLNELAIGKPFLGLSAFAVSPNGKLLAYSLDVTGFRQYTLQFKDLETGKTLGNKFERVTSVAWANDNRTVFYVTEDATTKRSDRLSRFRVGATPGGSAEELFHEPDELYGINVDVTRSKGYIVLNSESSETNEQYLLDARQPDGKFVSYLKRRENAMYYVDHAGNDFFIVINDTGRNFRLVTAP
ncbi:MAG: oligopeptidase B, partial [Betaproteobacteria bacterium]